MLERLKIKGQTRLIKVWFVSDDRGQIFAGPFEFQDRALDVIDTVTYEHPDKDLSDLFPCAWWVFPHDPNKLFCKADF